MNYHTVDLKEDIRFNPDHYTMYVDKLRPPDVPPDTPIPLNVHGYESKHSRDSGVSGVSGVSGHQRRDSGVSRHSVQTVQINHNLEDTTI